MEKGYDEFKRVSTTKFRCAVLGRARQSVGRENHGGLLPRAFQIAKQEMTPCSFQVPLANLRYSSRQCRRKIRIAQQQNGHFIAIILNQIFPRVVRGHSRFPMSQPAIKQPRVHVLIPHFPG
jgi:hypothetical protein